MILRSLLEYMNGLFLSWSFIGRWSPDAKRVYGALEVFNSHAPTFFSCCGKCLKKQMSQLPFARFDTFESGRHEELLAQYPQVVDILLFVVEHFRSTIYVHMCNSILLQHDKMLLTTAVHLRKKT